MPLTEATIEDSEIYADEGARLILAHKAGDLTAFAKLDQLYGQHAKNLARRILRDEHLAEDMVHEAWISILMPNAYNPQNTFKSYFLTIVANKCRDHLRKKSTQLEGLFSRLGTDERKFEPVDSGDAAALRMQRLDILVDQLLQHVSPEESKILQLRYLQGCSRQETADALSIGKQDVSYKVRRIKERSEAIAADMSW